MNNVGNSSNSKGNPIDLKTGHPFKCFNCDAEEHFSTFSPKPKRRRSYPVSYNEGNEEEGDNYTNLAEMASDYDVYLTKELGDDKKGPSLIGKTFNVALLDSGCIVYTVSMLESLVSV